MDNKAIEKERQIALGILDKIVEVANSIASDWDKKAIPLNMLRNILDKAKAKVTGDEYQKQHALAFNRCLKSLYTACVAVSEKMNTQDIAISALKDGIDIIKKAYK